MGRARGARVWGSEFGVWGLEVRAEGRPANFNQFTEGHEGNHAKPGAREFSRMKPRKQSCSEQKAKIAQEASRVQAEFNPSLRLASVCYPL